MERNSGEESGGCSADSALVELHYQTRRHHAPHGSLGVFLLAVNQKPLQTQNTSSRYGDYSDCGGNAVPVDFTQLVNLQRVSTIGPPLF